MAVPYIVYMPEIDRLLMLVGCDYPHQPFTLTSDDQGGTWSDPRPLSPQPEVNAAIGLCTSLTYLGEGRLIVSGGEGATGRWFSNDYGETWEGPVPATPLTTEQAWYQWDPYLVDRDPDTGQVRRLAETGLTVEGGGHMAPGGYFQAFIRFSTDEGRTWGPEVRVPQWHGVSEVALVRAANGHLVAAGRVDMARQYTHRQLDHYDGLGVSRSADDGQTWTPMDRLYCHGRMHPSMVLMPNRDIVMTYVVRQGYPRDEDGFPQFGIEAIVSRDYGVSWGLPRRYVLAKWSGNRRGAHEWWASSQATSTVLLPDGSLLTAYGTGYRSQGGEVGPRDVSLVRWWLGPD